MGVQVHHWGEIEYEFSVHRQLELVQSVRQSKEEATQNSTDVTYKTHQTDPKTHQKKYEDHLIFCQHPPLVTLGRSSSPEDIIHWKGHVFQSQRGGKATYHGPSQIVAYPIIDLCQSRRNLRQRDIHGYLRSLEEWLVRSLKELSIHAESGFHRAADLHRERNSNENLMTGVWVGEKKIACIGIAVKSWITYHGIALNLINDPQAFAGISPCGFQGDVMTSIEKILGKKLERENVTPILEEQFKKMFDASLSI